MTKERERELQVEGIACVKVLRQKQLDKLKKLKIRNELEKQKETRMKHNKVGEKGCFT